MPVGVQGLASGVTSISVGPAHSCAATNGAAYCWGTNEYGELGVDGRDDGRRPVPGTGPDLRSHRRIERRLSCLRDCRRRRMVLGRGPLRRTRRRDDGQQRRACAGAGAHQGRRRLSPVISRRARLSGAESSAGLNERASFGDGTTTNSAVPVRVQAASTPGSPGCRWATSSPARWSAAACSAGAMTLWVSSATGRRATAPCRSRSSCSEDPYLMWRQPIPTAR